MVAVTSVYRHKDSPQRGRDSWNSSDKFTSSEYTRTYHVVTDFATTDETIILQSSYVPQMFETDPNNYDARVISREAVRTNSPTVWSVEVTYSTAAPTAQDGDTNGSPLGPKVKWSRSASQITAPIWENVNGDLIKNTAHHQFNPPVEAVRFNAVYRAIRNELTYPSVQYEGKINSTNFLGRPPGTLMCIISSIEEEFALSLKYYRVTYEFHYDYRGWQPRVLSTGLMQIKNGKWVPCVDEAGQDVTSPVPLDANGLQISLANMESNTGVCFITVDAYDSIDFNLLGLTAP